MNRIYVTAFPTIWEENFDAYALVGCGILGVVRRRVVDYREEHKVPFNRVLVCVTEPRSGYANCITVYRSSHQQDLLAGDWTVGRGTESYCAEFLRKVSRDSMPEEFYRAYYKSPRYLARCAHLTPELQNPNLIADYCDVEGTRKPLDIK